MRSSAAEMEIQQAQEQINLMTNELSQLNVADTLAAFRMGDIINELSAYGKKVLQSVMKNAGVDIHTAKVRAWVSSKIPKDSEVRQFRSLSFSAFKEIAALPEGEQLVWAKKIESEGLTIKALREQLRGTPATEEEVAQVCPVTGVDLSTVPFPISVKVAKYTAKVATPEAALETIQKFLAAAEADKVAKMEAAAAKEAERAAARAAREAEKAALAEAAGGADDGDDIYIIEEDDEDDDDFDE